MSRSRMIVSIVTLICSAVLFTTTLHADRPKNKGNPNKGGNGDKTELNADFSLSATISAGISIGDARKLASNYQIIGAKPLPPGIRKNLARGKAMPPGIQKTRMPGSFVNELPYHEGYEWQQAGADLVLVVSGSLVISDILEGVFN